MSRVWIVAGLLAVSLCAGAAADEMPAETVPVSPMEDADMQPLPAPQAEPAHGGPPAPLQPYTPYNGRTAIRAWDRSRGYRYGTQMLFPFTRGMEDAGITGWARWPTALVTVPVDVALLPTGLIAGLFGS